MTDEELKELIRICDSIKRDRLDGDKFYIHFSRMQYLISQEQSRRAVQPEEAQRAIDCLENTWNHETVDGDIIGIDRYGRTQELQTAIDIAITALQQMQ